MKHLKLFEQFVNESNLSVSLFRYPGDFLISAMERFNKVQNSIRGMRLDSREYLSDSDEQSYVLPNGHKFAAHLSWVVYKEAGRGKFGPAHQHPEFIVSCFTKWRTNDVTPTGSDGRMTPEDKRLNNQLEKEHQAVVRKEGIYLLIISENPISQELVDLIFPKTATGSYKNSAFSFVRTLENFETKREPKKEANIKFRKSGFVDFKARHFQLVRYSVEEKTVNISLEKVMELPAYKDLEKTGYVMISDSKALARGTMTFAFPKAYAISDNRNLKSFEGGGEYLPKTLSIYRTGYIRVSWLNGIAPAVQSKFSSDTLEGWAEGLKKLEGVLQKWKKDYAKEGITLFTTPEERHANRGRIGGARFNF